MQSKVIGGVFLVIGVALAWHGVKAVK